MNTTQTTEYRVQLFHYANGLVERWSGFVIAMPYVMAEGDSRAAVLEEIRRKLIGAETTAEVAAVSVPCNGSAPLPDETPAEARLRARGHRHYGIFANDPGAMEVFDEIERQRDQFTIGHLNGEILDIPEMVPSPVEDEPNLQKVAA